MSSDKIQKHLSYEGSFLKSAFDKIIREFKERRKYVEKEIHSILSNLLAARKSKEFCSLEAVVEQEQQHLEELKNKYESMLEREEDLFQMLERRIQLLKEVENSERVHDSYLIILMDRLIIDYLARQGLFNTAFFYASCTKTLDFIDRDIYLEAHQISEELRKGKFEKALAWCLENRTKLERIQSDIEVDIRTQEFIEILRENRLSEALVYARKQLKPLVVNNRELAHKLSKVVTLLAIPEREREFFQEYSHFFNQERKYILAQSFVKTLYRFHSMPDSSLLTLYLQAGLTCLKTVFCEKDATQEQKQSSLSNSPEKPNSATPQSSPDGKVNSPASPKKKNPFQLKQCPICSSGFKDIAEGLPMLTRGTTKVLCRSCGGVMDDKNQPVLLPNGYCYCEREIKACTDEKKGKISDPLQIVQGVPKKNITQFKQNEAKKIYFC